MDEGEIEGGSESFGDTLAEGDWMYGRGASMIHTSRACVFVQRILLAMYSSCSNASWDSRKVTDFLLPFLAGAGSLEMMYLAMSGLYCKRNTLSRGKNA